MTKQEALNIVLNCSKIYHKNVENTKFDEILIKLKINDKVNGE